MITYSYKLNWRGKIAIAKYNAAIENAVAQSALQVQREAKKLLNKSGKGVVAKLGLNKVKGKGSRKLSAEEKVNLRFTQGMEALSKTKTVHGKKNKITFGGSFTAEDGTKTDRIYWYREPLHRWVQSSQPGTPPHKQTGSLQRIAVQFYNSKMGAKIGPQYGLKYARIQELGGRGMINLPPRPYMQPAYEMVLPKINDIFKKHLGRVTI